MIERVRPPDVPASKVRDGDGTTRRLVSTFRREEEAERRKVDLETRNLAYGVFRVAGPGQAERIEVKRVPRDHPRKRVQPDGTVWRLLRKCGTEGKALEAAQKERQRGN